MKCKHERARWSEWTGSEWRDVGTLSGHPLGGVAANFGRLICDCGAWLSLGPAQDGGPHAAQVAVEVRTAELEQWWHDADPAEAFDFVRRLSDDEARGWCIGETNMQNHTDAWHAGYLARYIATHPDGGNE